MPHSEVQGESQSLLDSVTQALARGATVLTANQRAARTLRHRIDRRNTASGLTHWEPAPIFAWDAWLDSLWRQLVLSGKERRLLLSATQEHHLWCSLIADDPGHDWSSLQSTDSLARLASDAWGRLCAYNGLARIASLDVHQDSRTCKRWIQRFIRRCQAEDYLSPAELEAAILSSIEASVPPDRHPAIVSASELYLVGFDSTTPSQEALLATLDKRGTTITRHRPAPGSRCYQHIASDAASELQGAANWLRQLLIDASPAATGSHAKATPRRAEAQRFAVILPSPATERSEIDRVFRSTLAPDLIPIQTPASEAAELPYEFSLGEPLAHAPMLVGAVDLMHWTTAPLPLRTLTRLLLTPSLCPADQYDARAEFDAFVLRRARVLRPEFSIEAILTTLQRQLARDTDSTLRPLLEQLQALQHTVERLKLRRGGLNRLYSEWADAMRQLLDAADWAPRLSLDNAEFQLRQKWENALDELATLDFDGSRPTFQDALDSLDTILGATLFAPQSRNAPIQIMGPLEAAGSEFDAIWFLRANETDWPSRPATSPLLGWQVQRQLAMPGADAALDHDYARRITERIAASADTVVFSSASQTPNGPQRPSPLLTAFQSKSLLIACDPPPRPQTQLEPCEEQQPVPFTRKHIQGGADLLKAQAACPFRAFAERRLWSTDLEASTPGMDAGTRGSLVHLTLQHLWQQLRDQATLRSLTHDQRTAAIELTITSGFETARLRATTPWDHAYLALQREHLHELLGRWLDLEAARQLPFTVKLREEKIERTIGPLHLELRYDRIDETEEGDVLIDYKTGLAQPKHWFGDRPDEPQLPLYAALAESPQLAAVAFALIRPGKEMQLHGIAKAQGILSKDESLPPDFESVDHLVEQWHNVLVALAEDFAAGDTRVNPKQPTTCKHCAQNLLCRIDPNFFTQITSAEAETDLESAE